MLVSFLKISLNINPQSVIVLDKNSGEKTIISSNLEMLTFQFNYARHVNT